jgi:DNA-binding response OmpR family regulator
MLHYLTLTAHAEQRPMLVTLLDYDKEQRSSLEVILSGAGYQCTILVNSKSLIDSLVTAEPDLLIAHFRSDQEALTTLTTAKKLWPELPVLLIAGRTPENPLAQFLTESPADFLIKPVRAAEFRFRINSLAMRHRPEAVKDNALTFGEYIFNKRLTQVMLNGQSISLTQKEFELALFFFQNLDRPLSRAFIHEAIWSQDAEFSSRTLDTHVSRVRSKLGLKPAAGYRLAPVYSFGYKLERLKD